LRDMKELTINRLPSITWHHLKVNDANIKWEDNTLACPMELKGEYTPLVDSIEFDSIATAAGKGFDETIVSKENISIDKDTTLFIDLKAGTTASQSKGINIKVANGINVTIYETIDNTSDTMSGLKIIQGKNSNVSIYKLLTSDKNAKLIDDTSVKLDDGSTLNVTNLILGKGDTYFAIRASLEGEGSAFISRTGYIGTGSQRVDSNIIADHIAKLTTSAITADGTLKDKAFKVFRGTIDFKKGCKGAKGDETENVLILDEGVTNKTVPIILCSEEDVEGNHAATIGRIDEETLFYFASRGIDEENAKAIISKGRLEKLISKIEDESIRETALNKLNESI